MKNSFLIKFNLLVTAAARCPEMGWLSTLWPCN